MSYLFCCKNSMKKIFGFLALVTLLGGGCVTNTYYVQQSPTTTTTNIPANNSEPTTQTVVIGGVVTVEIPKNCTTEGAAGSTYISCPTADNPTPTPEMVISSDGKQVNVKRWEGLESPIWNDVVKSLKITTPLDRAIQINVEK